MRLALRSLKARRRLDIGAAAPARAAAEPHPAPDTALWALVAELTAMQRAVVALRYLDDLTTEEIAAALECAPSTVRVHLHRATQRLGQLMNEEILTDD